MDDPPQERLVRALVGAEASNAVETGSDEAGQHPVLARSTPKTCVEVCPRSMPQDRTRHQDTGRGGDRQTERESGEYIMI